MRAFIGTLGPIWQKGALADKIFTATTSAPNTHGGQETTLLSLYATAMRGGANLVSPGYADGIKFEDAGNPCGFSTRAGEVDETA